MAALVSRVVVVFVPMILVLDPRHPECYELRVHADFVRRLLDLSVSSDVLIK